MPLAERDQHRVKEYMTREVQMIHPDKTLDDALEHQLDASGGY
jgi:predicted transcriptional regulator